MQDLFLSCYQSTTGLILKYRFLRVSVQASQRVFAQAKTAAAVDGGSGFWLTLAR